MTAPWLPVRLLDMTGSALSLVLAMACAGLAWRWLQRQRDDNFRHYIFLFTVAIAFFAVSRSAGHLLKQLLLLQGYSTLWRGISPYSGAINTATFIVIFAFGIYFQRFQRVQREIDSYKTNLERLVEERTTALEEANATLENIFNSSIPICITNTNFDVEKANAAYTNLWPESVAATSGLKCYESRPGSACHTPQCPMTRIMDGAEEVVCEITKFVGQRQLDFIVAAKPYRDRNGTVIGIVENYQDITARKRAERDKERLERQLRQAQKMEAIGTLAGGIAHDFNNILTALLGYGELAKMKTSPDADSYSDLQEIIKAGHRARDLVKHILTFSRQTEQQQKPVRIRLIVKEALKLLSATIPSSIRLKTDIADHCGTIFADPTQIHQVLMNLCTNAVHAMEQQDQGILAVTLKPVTLSPENLPADEELTAGDFIVLTVTDNGHGIPEAIRGRIFDPYFTTKDVNKGSGMGLSVVHGIVKGHNGAITVDSTAGRGTTFTVYFPTTKAQPTAVAMQQAALPHGTEHILLVDDEETVAAVTEQLLTSLGYRVTTRTSSIEALEAFRNQPTAFDLVLTDHTMPNMTGYHLARELLAIRPQLPIILCTGFSSQVDEKKAKEHGIAAFAMKPLVFSDVARLLRQVLDPQPKTIS